MTVLDGAGSPTGSVGTTTPVPHRGMPRPPKPPRRIPASMREPRPLGPREAAARTALMLVAVLLLGFIANLMVLGQLQHQIAQQNLENTFIAQLAEGTAPVSEGTVDDVLLSDGAPVALIEIPEIGLREVIVEGTDAATTKAGPGHQRDTVLPGQKGVSIIQGRQAAYGGPFSRLQELVPGQRFTVVTGQGEHTYEVIGLRYAGDAAPPPPRAGESRLILATARGAAYMPTGVARIDARLVSEAQPSGTRQTTAVSLPPQDRPLATDTSTVWALVFAAQLLLIIEGAAVWSFVRVGARKTWVVFAPLTLLAGVYVADQAANLLPNLL